MIDIAPALGLLSVIRPDGGTNPETHPFLDPESLWTLYRQMRRLRILDAALIELQREGRIGFYTASTGQEAVPFGTALAIEPTDWVFPARREGAVMLARGFSLERYLAQIFGTQHDVSKGRQMPGHMASRAVCVVSRSGSVGAQLPHAMGAALAARQRGVRAVTVAFCGDGGTSSTDFHAALNFAGVFRAPCVFVCQNNQVAISTPSSRQTASATFALKASAYGMPGVRVDGNDVLAVHRAVADARVRAVAGAGPTLVECVTFRMGSDESAGDGEPVPSVAASEEWTARDPIERLRRHLTFLGMIAPEKDAALTAELERETAAAIHAAASKAPPDRGSLFDDVYADRPWHLAEQAKELA